MEIMTVLVSGLAGSVLTTLFSWIYSRNKENRRVKNRIITIKMELYIHISRLKVILLVKGMPILKPESYFPNEIFLNSLDELVSVKNSKLFQDLITYYSNCIGYEKLLASHADYDFDTTIQNTIQALLDFSNFAYLVADCLYDETNKKLDLIEEQRKKLQKNHPYLFNFLGE